MGRIYRGIIWGILILVLFHVTAFSQDELGKTTADVNGENLVTIVEVKPAQLPASEIREKKYPKPIPPALKEKIPRISSEIFELPPLDLKKIIKEDEANFRETKKLRVSVHRPVSEFPEEKWRFITNVDDQYSWRIIIHSPQAVFIRPHFSPLPKESIQIYLYGEEGIKSLEGPIDIIKLSKTGYWGPVIEGEYLYIECITSSSESPPKLSLIEISHGYRNIPPIDLESSHTGNSKKK